MNISQCSIWWSRNDAMGHQLPRRLLVRAAAMALITDTKADDWGGCKGAITGLMHCSKRSP